MKLGTRLDRTSDIAAEINPMSKTPCITSCVVIITGYVARVSFQALPEPLVALRKHGTFNKILIGAFLPICSNEGWIQQNQVRHKNF